MDNNGNPFVGSGHINMAGQVGQSNYKYGRRVRTAGRAAKQTGSNIMFSLSNMFGARGQAKRELEGRVIKTMALGSAENALHLQKTQQGTGVHTDMLNHVMSNLPEGHKLTDFSYGPQGLKYSSRPSRFTPTAQDNEGKEPA
jgi:hypothetical protein